MGEDHGGSAFPMKTKAWYKAVDGIVSIVITVINNNACNKLPVCQITC